MEKWTLSEFDFQGPAQPISEAEEKIEIHPAFKSGLKTQEKSLDFHAEENRSEAGFEEKNESAAGRLKSSQRLQYEAQVSVIKKQVGELESVRLKLGLTRRKLAQLLLVDPSAWTRWVKEGEAPPHIYRALQWYMIIQERIPGLTPSFFLGKEAEFSPQAIRQQVDQRIDLELENLRQRADLQNALHFSSPSPDLQKLTAEFQEQKLDLQARIFSLETKIERIKKWSYWVGVAAFFLLAFFFFWLRKARNLD